VIDGQGRIFEQALRACFIMLALPLSVHPLTGSGVDWQDRAEDARPKQ